MACLLYAVVVITNSIIKINVALGTAHTVRAMTCSAEQQRACVEADGHRAPVRYASRAMEKTATLSSVGPMHWHRSINVPCVALP